MAAFRKGQTAVTMGLSLRAKKILKSCTVNGEYAGMSYFMEDLLHKDPKIRQRTYKLLCKTIQQVDKK